MIDQLTPVRQVIGQLGLPFAQQVVVHGCLLVTAVRIVEADTGATHETSRDNQVVGPLKSVASHFRHSD